MSIVLHSPLRIPLGAIIEGASPPSTMPMQVFWNGNSIEKIPSGKFKYTPTKEGKYYFAVQLSPTSTLSSETILVEDYTQTALSILALGSTDTTSLLSILL